MIQLILSGLALGCIYSLIALGYHLTFVTSKTVNFAQGSAMMLGAVVMLIVTVDFGYPAYVGIFVAIALLGLFGVMLERLAVRPFAHRGSVAWVLSTLAVGIVVENVVQLVFGKSPRGIESSLVAQPLVVAGAGIYPLELIIPAVVLFTVLAARLLYAKSMVGRALRATAYDREAAMAMGYRRQQDDQSFLCIELNTRGNWRRAVGSLDRCEQQYGLSHRPKGFRRGHHRWSAATGRNSGRRPGLRCRRNLIGGYLGSSAKEIFGFGLVILVLFLRPSGLFGQTKLRRI